MLAVAICPPPARQHARSHTRLPLIHAGRGGGGGGLTILINIIKGFMKGVVRTFARVFQALKNPLCRCSHGSGRHGEKDGNTWYLRRSTR